MKYNKLIFQDLTLRPGALAGVVMGTLIWMRFWQQGPSAWLVIGVSSLLSAVMAGVFGDIWWWQMINVWRSRWW